MTTMQGPLCEEAARLGHCTIGLRRTSPTDPYTAARHGSCNAIMASARVARLSEEDLRELARITRGIHARTAARLERERQEQADREARIRDLAERAAQIHEDYPEASDELRDKLALILHPGGEGTTRDGR